MSYVRQMLAGYVTCMFWFWNDKGRIESGSAFQASPFLLLLFMLFVVDIINSWKTTWYVNRFTWVIESVAWFYFTTCMWLNSSTWKSRLATKNAKLCTHFGLLAVIVVQNGCLVCQGQGPQNVVGRPDAKNTQCSQTLRCSFLGSWSPLSGKLSSLSLESRQRSHVIVSQSFSQFTSLLGVAYSLL
jgi:hypothetical protein